MEKDETPPRILVAEDFADAGEALATLLRRWRGAEVTVCDDGVEAARLFDRGRYDLLIVDAAMPVGDGYSFTEHVRASGSRAPVLMVTAHADSLSKAHARRVGVTRFMTKPYGMEEMLAAVDELLYEAAPPSRGPDVGRD